MKFLRYGLAGVGLVVLTLLTTIQLRWDRTFEAPVTNLRASTDPAAIERGRYLAYGPSHCADYHSPPADHKKLKAGEQPPLAGGLEMVIPPGKFRVPNITPDPETGIGRRSDEQLARMIRYGVRHDGRASVPFMGFQNLADDDVVALLSFLRSQPAVRHEVPEHELTFMGRAIMAFLIKPTGPAATPPSHSPANLSIETGEYLARSAAGCVACHTERSMVDGSYRPRFRRRHGHGGRDEPDPPVRYAKPHARCEDRTDRTMDRRQLPPASASASEDLSGLTRLPET
jgi:mono/diheme cytochrome c family protein